jgi:hypothetical protein
MANERIVSPGVFTRERDLSFLTQGISEIGGAFIGPTPKGPAFIPTIVRSQQEYVTRFGEADANHYTGLTVKNYLRESGVATIVRVLGTEGYSNTTTIPALVYVSGSGGNKLFAVIHPSSTGNTINSVTATGSGTSFTLSVDTAAGTDISNQSGLSVNPDSNGYLGNLLGYSPVTTKNSYIYAIFPDAVTEVGSYGTIGGLSVASQSLNASDVPAGVSTGSLVKYVIPTTSFSNLDTTKLSSVAVTGSGVNFASLLLTQYTATSASNIMFIVSSSSTGTLTTVTTYPKTSTGVFQDVIVSATTSSTALNFLDAGYSNAHTPWIQSQTIANLNVDLFKLHTLGDGNSANREIKVSLLNMKPSSDVEYAWGTFSLVIRKYDDTDARQEILEQYDNLTLDPDSPQYIARVIGNSAPTEDQVTGEMYYQGDFPNNSQYVYVEMNDSVIPDSALPFGFGTLESSIRLPAINLASPNYVTSRWLSGTTEGYTTESIDKRYYYGWDFSVANGTNESYLNPVSDPNNTNPIIVGTAFNLENLVEVPSGSSSQFSASISLTDDNSFIYRKFSVPFFGGFDGLNPARDIKLGGDILSNNSQGFDLSTSVAAGSKAYKKALNAISNPDQWDFNLLVLPGVIYDFHSYVANEALSLCEDRGDAFYIMDTTGLNATLATATAKAGEIDSNYAATYYPWLRVIDVNTNKLIWVPPSVILPEIYAYNDNVAAEWFAPAGLNRGGIASAVGVKVRLPQASRDTLYEGKVNPIAQFPGQGICVWGQKTLQRRPSALDRVNVRRLLIAVKKYIASASRYLVFEQNVESTRNRFLNIVNPYLASVQERSGLYAFRVIMDETNNTPDLIDRNILYGQLYLQPTRTAEFIILDFNVLPTGATFPTA